MRPKITLLFIISILTLAFRYSENSLYPQGYFRSPIDGPIQLTATFGELRPNHFHGGLDIRGPEGTPLFAIADGYISRIRVQASGYGNSITISHPNGYSSMYAHLSRFSPEIAAYVKKAQYEQEKFEVDLFPDESVFPLKKSDRIGATGNTGASRGAHLHFEIHDSKTDELVNPMLFGFKVNDTTAPRMYELKAYGLNTQHETLSSNIYTVIRPKGAKNYKIKGDTLFVSSPRAAFGLKVYDFMNGMSNKNGIYSLRLYRNDTLNYRYDMENFAYRDTRYLNAHLDYEEQVARNSYFNRCYVLPGNCLSIYRQRLNDGVIPLKSGKATKISIVAKDIGGNASKLVFWVKYKAPASAYKKGDYVQKLPYSQIADFESDGIQVRFPEGTFYENVYFQYQKSRVVAGNIYSAIHQLHRARTPVHDFFPIALRPDSVLPERLQSKAFVAQRRSNGSATNCGGNWKADGWMYTKVRGLGSYCIMTDTVPPWITASKFQYDMKASNRMSFKISDNFSVAPNVKGLQYRAYIDGKWVLMEFDAKNSLLYHWLDPKLAPGEHQLCLHVTDAMDNERVFESKFLK